MIDESEVSDLFIEALSVVGELGLSSPVQVADVGLTSIVHETDACLFSAFNSVESEAVTCQFLMIGESQVLQTLSPIAVTELNDWLREMCNLVAGQLKNKLIPMGIHSQVGLPTTVNYLEWLSGSHDWRAFRIETEAGNLFTCAQFEINYNWVAPNSVQDQAMNAGTVMLF